MKKTLEIIYQESDYIGDRKLSVEALWGNDLALVIVDINGNRASLLLDTIKRSELVRTAIRLYDEHIDRLSRPSVPKSESDKGIDEIAEAMERIAA